jgi:hypothetical protein
MTPEWNYRSGVTSRLKSRRAYLTFSVLAWALMMLVGVIGVGLFLHEPTGAFLFAACLLTVAAVFWLWVFRRFTR